MDNHGRGLDRAGLLALDPAAAPCAARPGGGGCAPRRPARLRGLDDTPGVARRDGIGLLEAEAHRVRAVRRPAPAATCGDGTGGPARQAAFAGLEDVPACLYLVSRDCRIVAMTARGRDFLQWGRVLTQRNERLHLRGNEAGLVAAVREVTEGRGQGVPRPFGVLVPCMPATGGGHLRVAAAGRASPGLACAVVGPLAAQRMTAIGVPLRRLYGLTPAEAELCECLKTGATLDRAAQALAIRRSTAVSQLKSVFAKTNTGRQAELLQLLLDLAAVC